MATGLVGMVSYKPLSLLNARLGRYPSARNSDMEIEVNSAIGALDVDVSEYLDAANATAKKEKDDISPKLDASKREQDEIKIDAAIQPFVREGMLAELFKHYQWRMLLLATPRRALASKNLTPASQPGLWSELVKVPRHRPIITTPFTALENFMTTSLADRFHPPSFRYKDNPLYLEQVICGHYAGAGIALPKLEYLHDLKLLVMRHANPEVCGVGEEKQQQEQEEDSHDATQMPFKLFDLKRYENPLWTKCMFYGHTTNNGSFAPTFQLVEWSRWEAVLGQDIVLVPLEYTGEGSGGEWQKRIRLRCVVLSNFAGGTGALSKDQQGGAKVENVGRALFVGVVDIEGEGRDDAVDIEAANIDLVGDVIIY
ncbi:hypothetical protein Micbo1qcDRAFT_165794 [Microdochium bolleyi]|uniref:Uncharacterized protein n=1 Tax=Microdochium bolleyi TaxID=196109 RepID=A0A136IW74_9PEZI|nr:hypothetical protein Micbo1qcDRAFT_165794 [Microdochium bolleyi]